MNGSDILIHIDESLDPERRQALEREIGDEQGVLSARINDRTRHLMLVTFNPHALQPSAILNAVRSRGLHAEMVGL
jgi:hypothetical protein